MRIVFICNEYPPRPHGGIGTFVQAVTRGLADKGHLITVVALGKNENEETVGPIRLVTLRGSRLPYVGNLVSRIRLRNWLSDRAKAHQIDVIEAPDYMGLLPLGVNGCPVVIRLHLSDTAVNLAAGQRLSRGVSLYERRTLVANPNWIGVSQHILDLTRSTFGVSPKRSAIVYNSVAPTPARLPEIPGLPTNFVLYAGAVSRRKGAVVLAQALRELMANRTDLHVVYAGGIYREGGRAISEEVLEVLGASLAERVHFLGHIDREKVLACMMRARIFAFPSNLEAFGLVALEAMDCGVPIVCTNAPPLPELVEHGVTGLLADPTSPRDFTEKIAALLNDSALGNRLASKARSMVAERFSLEKCLEGSERFYQECLQP